MFLSNFVSVCLCVCMRCEVYHRHTYGYASQNAMCTCPEHTFDVGGSSGSLWTAQKHRTHGTSFRAELAGDALSVIGIRLAPKAALAAQRRSSARLKAYKGPCAPSINLHKIQNRLGFVRLKDLGT